MALENPADFKITLGRRGEQCRVVMNGEDISHRLAGFTVRAVAGRATQVTLDFIGVPAQINGISDASEAEIEKKPSRGSRPTGGDS